MCIQKTSASHLPSDLLVAEPEERGDDVAEGKADEGHEGCDDIHGWRQHHQEEGSGVHAANDRNHDAGDHHYSETYL